MQVYKFGGASIASPERMRALLPILVETPQDTLFVVSAYGKTTNALETIHLAANKDKEEAHKLAKELENKHIEFAQSLLHETHLNNALQHLNVFFTELQWAIDDVTPDHFDYNYDQIVSMGELMSTTIFYHFLVQEGFAIHWQDIRDVIRTDSTYRDAKIDWDFTEKNVQRLLLPVLQEGKYIVTQGFIGATADNASVTLGREGSDYTAAVLAAMLRAHHVTIWKDVDGLQNADPKMFANTVKIESISFHEVIEMAYYGAQVIHPKTIKPLQNHNIPLYVKCFLNKDLKGTLIQNEVNNIFYPPLIILKENQILMQVTTRDFSFVTEDNMQHLYGIFHKLNIKVNLMQNAAISFVACFDHKEADIKKLISELEKEYKVLCNEGVSLLTVRHYTQEILSDLTRNKYILLEQKTRNTVQVVLI